MNFSSVKNIIFDLGGVIINIDFQYTFEAFARLGNTDILETLKLFKENKIFERYEKGEWSDEELRDLLRKELHTSASDDQIDAAWNALLLDIPGERIDLILKLKDTYNIFLLSNTNDIHIRKVNEILEEASGIKTLDHLFHKAYYSYKIGMSKPDVEIYEFVLREQGLLPHETVFLDDNKDNVEGAKAAGILALHVANPSNVLELLKNA